MKISERFDLDATQFELDFVDIDTDTDTPLFVDPFFLGCRTDSWSVNATRTLRSFFQAFVNFVRAGETDRAKALFDYLHEPNETCLGLSSGRPRGNAIGSIDGEKLFDSIAQSEAVATGVVEDLEDFRLFIDGIDKDKISDMTTNIIRGHLISYTQEQSKLWGIELQANVQSGFYWDRTTHTWINQYESMLIIDGRKILLTPKGIVSYSNKYTPQRYYNQFVLEYLQHEHLRNYSALVQHRVDGTPYVTKKSLKELPESAYSKEFLASFTEEHPEVFRDFKEWIQHTAIAISNEEMDDDDPTVIAEYLITKLGEVSPGGEDATKYHRLVVGILEFLLYPDVVSPIVENEIHDGRKRIDITFDNSASSGFFHRLHTTYQTPAQFIFVECKNYSREVANPEIDQLSGRFSMNRGKFGLLLCREVDDMDTLLARCNDTYVDGRGIMLPLVDEDLITMLNKVIEGVGNPHEEFLTQRFRAVALN
ncbi:MAG: hypothetical protein JAY63_17850 [Candidatus Thiodiazotropha taylori]|nr:hypothetical protein [Candidatus Thiodiazotropha taylori]